MNNAKHTAPTAHTFPDGLPILRPMDDPSMDPSVLACLVADKGERDAETLVCRALEEMARKLQQVETFHMACNFTEMAKAARCMRAVSSQIGMLGVARVADMVLDCIDNGDPVALGATLARLTRVTDQSMIAIWDIAAPV